MAYNIQEQVNSLEEQGIGALTKQLQHNPKLVVGIALENLQKDMQEAERAKQIGGGDTGLPIIDKKLTSLSGGPSGQRDAMAAAGPGLQQRGQQLQGQQLLKSLFQAAKTPGGIPAAMAQAGGGAGGMPTQRMAMGGIAGYAEGGDVENALYDEMGKQYLPGQPIPDDWLTLSNSPEGTQLPFNPAGGHFADEIRRMERTRREYSTRTIPEFLSDFTFSRSNAAREALRSPLPALLQSQVDSGSMSEQEAANELQKILSGPRSMGERWRWNRENPNFLPQLEAMKEARERVLEAQKNQSKQGAPALLPETETFLEATEILENPESTDEQKAFAQMQLEGLEDAPMRAEMLQQVDKIRSARKGAGMAHGGIVGYANRGLVSGGDVDIEVLLDAIRQVESGGNPNADSGYAYGAYQIDPTAGVQPGYGVDPIDVHNSTEEEQRRYARDYLKAMLGEFGGDLEPALQAYNVGPNALNQIRAGERDMPAETADYYSDVMKEYGNRTMPQGSLMARSQQRAAADRGGADRVGSPSRNVNPRGRRDFSTNLNLPAPSSLMARSQQRAAALPDALRNDWAGRDSAIEATQAPVNFWEYLASQQAEKEAGASRAGRYMGMGANTQDMINRADPAATLEGIDTNKKFEVSDRGIMSQVPRGPFRSNRDRFAQAIGPEAVEAIQQNQQRRAEAPEAPKEYAPGVLGDLREIGDYLKGIFGFQEGGTVDGEEIIPLKDVPDEGGRISGIVDWAKENPFEAASLGLMFVPGLGWGYAGARAGLMGVRALAPKGIAALGRAFGPGSKARKIGEGMFTRPNTMPKGWKGMADPGRPYLRGKKGWEAATSPQGKIPATRAVKGTQKTREWNKTSLADAMKLKPNDPKVAAELAKIRSGGGSTYGSVQKVPGKYHMTPGTPAVAARDPLVNPRVFSPARTTAAAAAPGVISGGLGALGLGSDSDEAQAQVQRDTSNLDRNRPFDTEAFSEAYPGVVDQWRQEDRDRHQRNYDEQRAARLQKEAERQRKEERGGIMSQVGSALGSPQAQRFYSAMQDLGYAGGAPRGQEGAQMVRGLAARDAQNRELQALEDKVVLEREMMELTERLAQMELTDTIFNTQGFMDYLKTLAEELDVSINDPNLLPTAMQNYRALLGLSGPVEGTPELTLPSPAAEAQSYLDANP